jgi:Spy/CpxP family protein refolding chaperone
MRDFAGHSLHRLLRHQKDLGLSAEQSAKIKATATDYAKARIRGEADFKLAELEVRTLARDETADLPAVEAALKKSESAHTALRLEGIKALRAATAVLTPEQREKWRAGMMAGHREDTRPEMHSSDRNSDAPMASSHELPKREG